MGTGTVRVAESTVLASIGAAAVVAAACIPVSAVEDGPVICPFRHLTGLPCPGCGLTRAFVYTMHGDFSAAVTAHAFGPFVVVLAVVSAVVMGVRRARGSGPFALREAVTHPVVLLGVGVWMAYAIARMIVAG
ncbi:DUF2752 domain-containing protein [Gordonia sp. HY002]|uniref:DUF2752 domain-containing protein n=1 Tax=Gordonia zhenghanii TaxID=2911516 RepID=UPI001EF06AA3|nr:DUF2752 domain-containing protein [Gordonia zhenghanii]MCF8569522.1 DUF2752 domain-containing protein [Gordonia zhenghanii]MCF8603897.1 DUF2752 domain-containing protein [Gordonia zhenghanii]